MSGSSIAGIGSGLFAILAAGLWFWSAAIRLPPQTARLSRPEGGYARPAREVAMDRQSRISAWAALCAGAAALLQVASALLV